MKNTLKGWKKKKHEEHDEHEEEYDEHVWTSPKNAMEIVSGLNKRMCALDQKHASKFNENTENYIKQIASVDSSFKQMVKQAKKKRYSCRRSFPVALFCERIWSYI